MFVYAAVSQLRQWFIGVRHTRKRTFMIINLPDDVSYIINKLIENGYEAYAVGGCVRDSIIHRVPGDWDITTSATPYQVKAIFRRTIDTGIKHGTVTIMIDKEGYEVTTYRIDGEYLDGRHPNSVEFTSSLTEDLKRRDFTINAMAYNNREGIVDNFNGKEDIEKKIIRCVGNPIDRFTEDALRMLRAIRFSAQLGYKIEPDTASAIKELAPTIAKVSKERIQVEIAKTLLSDNPDYIKMVYDFGISKLVFAAFDKVAKNGDIYKVIKSAKKTISHRYAALLYSLSKDEVVKMLKELKLDNVTINATASLVQFHGRQLTDNEQVIRHTAYEVGVEALKEALQFEINFYNATGDLDSAKLACRELELYNDILDKGQCLEIKNLAIDGGVLTQMGVKPGKDMGMLLKKCLELVLDNPELNNENNLRDYVNSILIIMNN